MYVELLCFALVTISVSFLEENEYGVDLNCTTREVFSSLHSLRRTVESVIAEMVEVENNNLLLGEKGDVKYDFLAETSENYTIHAFGSRAMGLGFKTSDLDVFVDMGNCYRGGGQTTPDNSVQRIAEYLSSQNKSFYYLNLIERSRVPILELMHRNTGIHIDVSTRNGLGIENSRLVRGYLADERVKFVTAAVKMWSLSQGVAKTVVGPRGISSYCIVWLVMFALMQTDPPAVTSPVELKRAYTGPELFVDGWECGHYGSIHPKSNNTRNEIELLYHFFDFYSRMSLRDVKEHVICPHTGILVPKEQFWNTPSLPREFDNYKEQVGLNSSRYQMSTTSTLCVQDPVEQSNNIAKAVEDWVLVRFLSSCNVTAKIMQKIIHPELHNKFR